MIGIFYQCWKRKSLFQPALERNVQPAKIRGNNYPAGYIFDKPRHSNPRSQYLVFFNFLGLNKVKDEFYQSGNKIIYRKRISCRFFITKFLPGSRIVNHNPDRGTPNIYPDNVKKIRIHFQHFRRFPRQTVGTGCVSVNFSFPD